jgi:hypothetical protein
MGRPTTPQGFEYSYYRHLLAPSVGVTVNHGTDLDEEYLIFPTSVIIVTIKDEVLAITTA